MNVRIAVSSRQSFTLPLNRSVLGSEYSAIPRHSPSLEGADITLDSESFACIDCPVQRIFITENETNFLAFPPAPGAMVIFGAGYGFDMLGEVDWLNRCRIYYWGDIDTHGFAILDQLRAHFAEVENFLMDRETLDAFHDHWTHEPAPTLRNLPRLTANEQCLYDVLRDNRIQPNLRLEQERVGYKWIEQRLAQIASG